MNKKWIGGLLLAMGLLLIVGGCSNQQENNEIAKKQYEEILANEGIAEKYLVTNVSGKEAGITRHIVEYKNHLVYGVNYPYFGVESIDKSVKKQVDQLISQIEKSKKDYKAESPNTRAIINVDYESYTAKDRIVSIKYNIYDYTADRNKPISDSVVQKFDLYNGKEVENKDIFMGDYLNFFAQYGDYIFRQNPEVDKNIATDIYKEGIAGTEKNYRNTVLLSTGVEIVYPTGQLFPAVMGVTKVFIPYEELVDYIDTIDISKTTQSDEVSKRKKHAEENEVEQVSNRIVNPNKPMVALTFDDGPSANTTNRILNALKKVDGRGTFFVLGERLDQYADILKREHAEGHEIGNHSFNHPNLTNLSPEAINEQLSKVDTLIEKYTGTKPALMRPTYGAFNDKTKASVDRPLIMWSLDTLDWKSRNADAVVTRIMDRVSDGDIILLHDLYTSTAEAVEKVVPKLVEQGYQLVTVSELMTAKGIKMEASKEYFEGGSFPEQKVDPDESEPLDVENEAESKPAE